MIRKLRSVVPLSESAGRIACRLESLRDCHLIEIEPLGACGDAAHAPAGMVSAGEKLGARRCTDRADVKTVDDRAVAREGIDLRSREIRVAVDAEVAPSLIVG